MMQKAAIDYHGGELQVWEQEDVWTVRLGELEASSRYLDLALAELLDDAEGAHELAARLLMELISTPAVTATSDLVGGFAAGEPRGDYRNGRLDRRRADVLLRGGRLRRGGGRERIVIHRDGVHDFERQ